MEKRPPLYLCDAKNNTECRKTGCAFEGNGDCYSTKNPAFAVRGKSGKPIITSRFIVLDNRIIGRLVAKATNDNLEALIGKGKPKS